MDGLAQGRAHRPGRCSRLGPLLLGERGLDERRAVGREEDGGLLLLVIRQPALDAPALAPGAQVGARRLILRARRGGRGGMVAVAAHGRRSAIAQGRHPSQSAREMARGEDGQGRGLAEAAAARGGGEDRGVGVQDAEPPPAPGPDAFQVLIRPARR